MKVGLQESGIRSKYEDLFKSKFAPAPYWHYWIGYSIVVLIFIGMSAPKISDQAYVAWSVLGGALAAAIAKSYFESKTLQSPEYKSFHKDKEFELNDARECLLINCPKPGCQRVLRFTVASLMSPNSGRWNCPNCKTVVNPLESLGGLN